MAGAGGWQHSGLVGYHEVIQSPAPIDGAAPTGADEFDLPRHIPDELVEVVVDEYLGKTVAGYSNLNLSCCECVVEQHHVHAEHAEGNQTLDHGNVVAGQQADFRRLSDAGAHQTGGQPLGATIKLLEGQLPGIVGDRELLGGTRRRSRITTLQGESPPRQ
ncbi:Uncharacterised protein [Mycobacteroides abscessus subsp. abscessus]|nr:Uncharacterised protein [Mycobacteroides abscessus subsp. abscessus]